MSESNSGVRCCTSVEEEPPAGHWNAGVRELNSLEQRLCNLQGQVFYQALKLYQYVHLWLQTDPKEHWRYRQLCLVLRIEKVPTGDGTVSNYIQTVRLFQMNKQLPTVDNFLCVCVDTCIDTLKHDYTSGDYNEIIDLLGCWVFLSVNLFIYTVKKVPIGTSGLTQICVMWCSDSFKACRKLPCTWAKVQT